MAYQSIIEHQARSHYRCLRSDYIAICKGAPDSACAAAILDLAEFWTNHILDKSEEELPDGVEIQADLWFFRSEDLMAADLFNAWGLNKLRNNREWLIGKKFLALKKEVRPVGGFINYYRLEIETVQAEINALPPVKNKGRDKGNRSLEIKGASFRNNAIRKVVNESLDDSGDLEAMKTAVKTLLKQYNASQCENVARCLLGLHSGKKAGLNLETPITVEQLSEFCIWWDKKKDRNGEKLTRPRNMDSILPAVSDWLQSLKPAADSRKGQWGQGFAPDMRSESELLGEEQ